MRNKELTEGILDQFVLTKTRRAIWKQQEGEDFWVWRWRHEMNSLCFEPELIKVWGMEEQKENWNRKWDKGQSKSILNVCVAGRPAGLLLNCTISRVCASLLYCETSETAKANTGSCTQRTSVVRMQLEAQPSHFPYQNNTKDSAAWHVHRLSLSLSLAEWMEFRALIFMYPPPSAPANTGRILTFLCNLCPFTWTSTAVVDDQESKQRDTRDVL